MVVLLNLDGEVVYVVFKVVVEFLIRIMVKEFGMMGIIVNVIGLIFVKIDLIKFVFE